MTRQDEIDTRATINELIYACREAITNGSTADFVVGRDLFIRLQVGCKYPMNHEPESPGVCEKLYLSVYGKTIRLILDPLCPPHTFVKIPRGLDAGGAMNKTNECEDARSCLQQFQDDVSELRQEMVELQKAHSTVFFDPMIRYLDWARKTISDVLGDPLELRTWPGCKDASCHTPDTPD